MYKSLEQRLCRISDSGQASYLTESRIGLEKESLRVAASGGLAQTRHPNALGSALTNPYVTTDFAEAMPELITPPCDSIREALTFLDDIQQFVYSNLDADEILWATSMPCVVEGGDSVPIAEYGPSNSGMMKTIYRRGLGHRYGRTMQVIAGVHFNYSFSAAFWDAYQTLENNTAPRQQFIDEHYMGLVRNTLRFGWLIPYLFGASPAVCKSFLHGKRTILSEFNETTVYEPYATSLRMGDIGYTNNKESMAGIKADYSSLDAYVKSLQYAIETPFDEYETIGVKVDGEYRQLNANILQIENEYYSTVRPKQVLDGNEKPTAALSKRGIAYVEIRSLDVNAFDPLGVNEEQLDFLELFVLFCLLHDSPVLQDSEIDEIDENLVLVAHSGRQPGLKLSCCGKQVVLKDWALELCEAMKPVAQLLDQAHKSLTHTISIEKQIERVLDPERTVSAFMLEQMRDNKEGFYAFAKRLSLQHHEHFVAREMTAKRQQLFEQAATDSLQLTKQIEAQDSISFDEFLQQYFAQE